MPEMTTSNATYRSNPYNDDFLMELRQINDEICSIATFFIYRSRSFGQFTNICGSFLVDQHLKHGICYFKIKLLI